VSRLAAGTYAGTGSGATVTLGAATTVANILAIDAGTLATGSQTLSASLTSSAAEINGGTLSVGSAALSFAGGLTVRGAGTLSMATSGGSVRIAAAKTLTMDGTLSASSTGATIRNNGSGNYAFNIGTTSTAAPTLNVSGLAVQNTDGNGMRINVDPSSVTTFTRFDNLAFSSGTGTRFLQIYAKTLYLSSNGCSFDSGVTTGTTTYAVTLAGNGYAGSPDATETRAMFGGTTCANNWTVGTSDRACLATAKSDDDADNNGIGGTGSNGAVVQFVRGTGTDTAGTIEGLPTAAFDWTTFQYYSTYVAFHDVSGTVDRVYVRDQTGAAKYSWDTPAGESIVGTPKWNTVAGSHYLFVALASGKVYRLIDNGASLVPASGWGANPYDCGCTIVTPLATDASNLFWGGTASGNKVWTLGQSSGSAPMGSPLTITPALTTAAPASWTNGGTTYLFMGVAGHILQINANTQALVADNTNPGAASVYGRISVSLAAGTARVLAGDSGGNFWAVAPFNFADTNRLWSYAVTGDSIQSTAYSDTNTSTVQFGTEAGKVVVLNVLTGAARTGYPFTPGASSDTIRSAMLYTGGILAVGTTTGKLFFIDRNNGTTGPTLLQTWFFGPTETVSGVGYDSSSNRYMVATSDSASKDGRLYYIDRVTDPTSGSL
jgi:hypothetical protein